MRIAIGGISHETNTFSTLPTTYADFEQHAGAKLLDDPRWRSFTNSGVELIPLFTAHATPSGRVTRAAFERLLDELLSGIISAGTIDGILLILHGAMEVEEIGDGETAIINAVRAECGPEVFITVTLDLHANLAPVVTEECDIVTAYRTAPHRDVEETNLRGMALMIRCLDAGITPVTRMVKLPLLVSGEAAVTEVEPSKSLFAELNDIDDGEQILCSSILIGCAWTDSTHTSVSTVVSGTDEEASMSAAHTLAQSVWDKRAQFEIDSVTASLEASVGMAIDHGAHPVFISDSGDNTTAGAAGDSPSFLRFCAENRVQGMLIAGITDRAAHATCRAAGHGAAVRLSIGGKLDAVNEKPYICSAKVIRVTPEKALIRVDSVDAVVQTHRRPFTTLGHFREMGIEPRDYKAIVVKEGYLFPELRDYAPHHIMAFSPGFGDQRLHLLPYTQLKRPVYPFDPDIRWNI